MEEKSQKIGQIDLKIENVDLDQVLTTNVNTTMQTRFDFEFASKWSKIVTCNQLIN